MFLNPKRDEIDHRTIKLIVGLIAIFLANVTSFFSATAIQSISASYHEGGWARDIFVGSLFAISASLLAYNGRSSREMGLSKVAAFAGMGVAMFPCECGNHAQIIPYVHGTSAAIMFLVLAVFCYIFFGRARAKGHSQAKLRSYIYAICGIVITAAILVMFGDHILDGALSVKIPRLTFYGERAGLIAFGTSWLTASRVFPGLAREDERFSPFTYRHAKSLARAA
jgi:uncharacterized membrane protein